MTRFIVKLFIKLSAFYFLIGLMIAHVWAEIPAKENDTLPALDYETQTAELLTADDQAALSLGRKISAILQAMDHPELPENMKIITQLGTDQRYYTLVRGWLGYQLQADMSILQARQGQVTDKIQQRIKLLQEAIRRIDLE